MRIIAGEFKRRTLKAPTWAGLRPTSDRLRETLFNILSDRVAGGRVLDVFAGTGAVGLEALSRGAESAVFIESDRRAATLIAENAARCRAADRCAIIRGAAELVLHQQVRGGPFDLVILDPPYEFERRDEVVALAAIQLAPGGRLVLEHAARRPPAEAPGLALRRTVRAGDSALSFYERA
ncbi:MAG: 16S rRNA (guanine(966)-N(2))-methyltransferase RsmD [Acidobacteriota bacterium]